MQHSEYQKNLNLTGEFGTVTEVRFPLVVIDGLPSAVAFEEIVFDDGQRGIITALHRKKIHVLMLTRDIVRIGSKATRTGTPTTINCNKHLLGATVNAQGIIINQSAQQNTYKDTDNLQEEIRPVEQLPLTILHRKKITRQMESGTTIVDLLLPLSHGQRSVVLGDRKTGKTTFLYTLIKAQADKDTVVVIAAIGKKWSGLKHMDDFLTQNTKRKNTVLVSSGAHEAPGMIYLTPYTAMTIAEYFRDQGRDVLVIMEDLSTHAQFYREIALLGKSFPGSESYPGDMFYTHSRLLERAGNFIYNKEKETSITCIVTAETVDNRMTNTIVSNLISMTDGHILFDNKLFNAGRRPGIDHSLSVTRVGNQVQLPVAKKLQYKITALLAQYSQTSHFTHFGAELSESVRTQLELSELFLALLSQPPFVVIPLPVQVTLAGMIWLRLLDPKRPEKIADYRDSLSRKYLNDRVAQRTLDEINSYANLDKFFEEMTGQKEKILVWCEGN